MSEVNELANHLFSLSDHQLLIALVAVAGGIFVILLGIVVWKLLGKKTRKVIIEDLQKELENRRALQSKLNIQLENADIDQKQEIQARIDKNNKVIASLEKKTKLPKATA